MDAAAEPGQDTNSIDGAAAMPDLRSRWQPEGVHKRPIPSLLPKARCRPRAARPPKPAYIAAERVIYELHVGTFTPLGTYAAAAEKLGYLSELGVTHVELTATGDVFCWTARLRLADGVELVRAVPRLWHAGATR